MNGGCYYFEKKYLNYTEAQENCKTKFGPGLVGRLVEPQTIKIGNALVRKANATLGVSTFWMGYDHIGHPQGDFHYVHTKIISPFDREGHPNLSDGVDGDCARIRWNSQINDVDLDDVECSSLFTSVCEVNSIPKTKSTG